MIKNLVTSLIFSSLLLLIFGGKFKSEKNTANNNILQFALYCQINDMYQGELSEYFKAHKIKTISFVSKESGTNQIDSLTYLEIKKTGKIIRRTTKECTTIGCLPYMNRQEYHYKNGRLNQIDIYTFKNEYVPVISKWLDSDTSSLDKFDWNNYSYDKDTIFVETAISEYKFVKNKKGEITFRKTRIKSTNQIVDIDIHYKDSTIIMNLKPKFANAFSTEKFKIDKNHIELISNTNRDRKYKLVKVFNFGSDGLVNDIKEFRNGKVISNTKLSYTFYD